LIDKVWITPRVRVEGYGTPRKRGTTPGILGYVIENVDTMYW
jgi:hypothetical protein